MENDIKDTLTVEQAKKALGTDEKGLLSLDDKTIAGIRDGLATAVYNKDVEDNKENSEYVTVKLEDFLKSIGATISADEFKARASELTGYNPVVASMGKATGESVTNITNSNIVNNNPVNINSNITINEASDPVQTAVTVQQYIKNLLQQAINSTK